MRLVLLLGDESDAAGPMEVLRVFGGGKIMKIKNPGSAALLGAATVLGLLALSESAFAQAPCERIIKADVVALDQAFYNNRLGAFQAGGMVFALRRDVVSTVVPGGPLTPGKVMLRPDKRPRPIVLRATAGDCLQISFQNLLDKVAEVVNPNAGNQVYPVRPGSPYVPNQNAMIEQSASPPSP